MIHVGRFSPGDRLPSEKEIMEELGVGRSAVREAMLSLQKMGLVTVQSGERARVTTPTANVLVHELSGAARLLLAQEGGVQRFQEARALFEIGLARLAAEQATPEDLRELKTALENNKASIGDNFVFMQTDVAFHYVIAAIPRNPIFTSLHDAVVGWLTEQRAMSGRAPTADRDAYAAHERIYDAIAAHDPAEAQARHAGSSRAGIEILLAGAKRAGIATAGISGESEWRNIRAAKRSGAWRPRICSAPSRPSFGPAAWTTPMPSLLAGALVNADQRGIHSHGTLRVPDYVDKLTKGGVDPRGRPAIASATAPPSSSTRATPWARSPPTSPCAPRSSRRARPTSPWRRWATATIAARWIIGRRWRCRTT